jgi:hypothetical protein
LLWARAVDVKRVNVIRRRAKALVRRDVDFIACSCLVESQFVGCSFFFSVGEDLDDRNECRVIRG